MMTLSTYNAAPAAEEFEPVTLEFLRERLVETEALGDGEYASWDEWRRNACDGELADLRNAIQRAEKGETILFAEDQDGGYYAIPE